MQDIFSKCHEAGGYFSEQRVSGDTFFARPLLPPIPANRMEFQGKECIMWSINNYLGLATDPEIKQAAINSVQEYGLSAPMGARMMSGTTIFHRQLEQELADFAQKEAAYLFNYGYMGVLGIMSALAGTNDTIITDKLAHACIIDGGILSRSNLRFFKHNNVADLESILKQVSKKNSNGGVLVAIEGVYGMTGDIATLQDICALKKEYPFRLFVDDAHGCGIMGDGGRGTGVYCGVQNDIDIYFGTFAKAFAAIGGFCAAEKMVIEWIEFNARTQVFAKSLPLAYTQTIAKSLSKIRSGDENRKKLWHISKMLKDGLRDIGYCIGPGDSPICSVFIPTSNTGHSLGKKAVHYLRTNGIFVTGVIYPVIPPDMLMFRMIPTAAHKEEDVQETIQVFHNMQQELSIRSQMNESELTKLRQIFGNKL